MQSAFLADLAELYPDLDPAFLAHAGEEFESVRISGGEPLVRMGEPSDAIYILVRGRLVATRADEEGRSVRLGEIGRGEIVGEMSVLTGATRTATVTALRDSELVRIPNRAFVGFMQRHPSVMRQFVQVLTQRLASRPSARRGKVSTVALVPAGGRADARDFARALGRALASAAPVLVLGEEDARLRFPGDFDGADPASLAAWLNDLELDHGMLLYPCGAGSDRWTSLCLRQADRVLLVADAADAPEPGALEAALCARGEVEPLRDCELVLLHEQGVALPRGAERWIGRRSVRRHHHLRMDDQAHMARLARALLGRSIGLVLGGGGARAFTEIGVLRALERAGIPVDAIGGTSMGAVIGALAALGHDAQAIHRAIAAALRFRPFSGVTLPMVSLLSGRRLARTMRFLFGGVRIEDLWRPCFSVSCNLTRGAVDARASGELARWVTASNAIPGIVPPVLEGGELYVDGGLLNNLPVDVMSAFNPGPVIAASAGGAAALRAGLPDDADLSGWRLWLDGLGARGGSGRMPRLGPILVRSMLLASANHSRAMRAQAAVWFEPPVHGVDPNDWDALDTLVESGYRHAQQTLEGLDRRCALAL